MSWGKKKKEKLKVAGDERCFIPVQQIRAKPNCGKAAKGVRCAGKICQLEGAQGCRSLADGALTSHMPAEGLRSSPYHANPHDSIGQATLSTIGLTAWQGKIRRATLLWSDLISGITPAGHHSRDVTPRCSTFRGAFHLSHDATLAL